MAKSKQKSIFSTFGFRLLLLVTVVAVSVYGLKNWVANNLNVLGTSVYIADQGSDSGSSGSNDTGSHDSNQLPPPPPPPPPSGEHEDFNAENLSNVSFDETGSHNQIRLGHSSIEMSTDDGHLQIRARHEDGSETELEDDSLGKINDALENEDIEISTHAGGFLLRKGQFGAQTHFPLSINPTTNELTVTTPAGTKVVAVLPDQAVNNLINNKFINVVASDSANTGINLGLFDNQSAFQIQGKLHKKFLGFIPVDVDKTIYVSTENGNVLNTDQSILSRLLDLLSVAQ